MGGVPGRALFLVGPSSAGKTALGHALLPVLPEPYLFFESDRFGLWHPTGRADFVTPEMEEAVTRGSALAVRGYLDAGVNLVVERGFWHPESRKMAAAVFEAYDAWLIGLRWDVDVLQRREAGRRDGIVPGTARRQATNPCRWDVPYDQVVDTMNLSPHEAAAALVQWLDTKPTPFAIREITRLNAPGG